MPCENCGGADHDDCVEINVFYCVCPWCERRLRPGERPAPDEIAWITCEGCGALLVVDGDDLATGDVVVLAHVPEDYETAGLLGDMALMRRVLEDMLTTRSKIRQREERRHARNN